jgi:hypothetical protein
MTAVQELLLQAIRHPESTTCLELAEWDLLLRQVRRAGLLARFCILLDEHRVLDAVPARVLPHLTSARTVAAAQERAIHWEVNRITKALTEIDIVPIILLKGTAYLMAGLPPARGRIFGDVDIMVPRAKLDAVERALRRHGWLAQPLDSYDDRYYRQWTHELPPLRHIRRHTVLDVHHNILPETARLHPDPTKLIAAAQPLNGADSLTTLAPADMVLHSATHLLNEGEFENGLRDLVDLDDLLRYFGREESFWLGLVERAQALDLSRPLYYALRYTRSILGTPVPEEVGAKASLHRPRGLALPLMDAAFTRALAPDHPSYDTVLTKPARFFLYVRSHYLRMPLHLLVPHLMRKAIKRRPGSSRQPCQFCQKMRSRIWALARPFLYVCSHLLRMPLHSVIPDVIRKAIKR